MCGGIYQGSNTTSTIIGGVWLLVIEWCHTIQKWNEKCIFFKVDFTIYTFVFPAKGDFI